MLSGFFFSVQYIDVPGTVAVCEALKLNKSLHIIDLGLNKIRNVCTHIVMYVGETISPFKWVQWCLLQKGAAAVKEMLATNTTLESIALKFNFIPDPSAIQCV